MITFPGLPVREPAMPRIRPVYSEISSNKRRSVVFVGLFFVIWLAIGAVLGLLFKAVYHPSVNNGYAPTSSGWTPVIVGMVICGTLAIAGILYSLTAGAGMVLRVSGAVPADPAQYPQLHNLVEALAIGEGIPNRRSTSSTIPRPTPLPPGSARTRRPSPSPRGCSPS